MFLFTYTITFIFFHFFHLTPLLISFCHLMFMAGFECLWLAISSVQLVNNDSGKV